MTDRLREFDLPFESTHIHCWEAGTGNTCLIFLHGSGTGAQTMSNFKRVLEPLAEDFRIVASDLIGYGQSGLSPNRPYFNIDMWSRQLDTLIARVQDEAQKVVLVGHSLSGSLMLKAAASPRRITGVIGTASFGVSYPVKPGTRSWILPETKQALRLQTEGTVYEPSLIDDEEIEMRWSTISRPGYRQYFSEMFSENRQFYLDASALSNDELHSISCPVLLMHGLNDKSMSPEATSLVLARQIMNCDVVVFNRCAHSIALEKPSKFMTLVRSFAGSL